MAIRDQGLFFFNFFIHLLTRNSLVSFVSLVSVVSFRSFRFIVSGFSDMPYQGRI